jgi:hypothetical protein
VEGRTERRYLKHLSDALPPGSKVEYRARGPDWLKLDACPPLGEHEERPWPNRLRAEEIKRFAASGSEIRPRGNPRVADRAREPVT